MGRVRKARAEGESFPPNPVPGDDGDALGRIADYFRFRFPEDWDRLRLCPLQHGLEDMARLMRGRG